MGLQPEVKIISENLSEADAFALEKKLIAKLRAEGVALTNVTDGGDGTFGYTHTEESKDKIRMAGTGRRPSEETLKKLRQNRHTDETRARISATKRGRVHSEETRRKISQSQIGRKASDSTREKMSKTRSGRPCLSTTREKISLANTGKKRTISQIENNAKVRRKPVICLETGKIYSCASEAAKEFGMSPDNVRKSCHGKVKNAKGKTFRYVERAQ